MVPSFKSAISVELRSRAAVLHHRKTAQLVHALHAVLRQLHLDLKGVARNSDRASSSAAVKRDDEVAGTTERDHIGHGQAELSGALAVDGDVERGIVAAPGRTADRAGKSSLAICARTFCA